MNGQSIPRFSPLLEQAFAYANELHQGQGRKGSRVPYLAHLMSVTALVLEHGGNEDEAIAALLHDGPEDCGGRPVLQEIRQRFGSTVAAIVEGCTDTLESPKPAWYPRKQAYLDHLPDASASILLVSLADKVHNVRSILNDYRHLGERVWGRFTATREEALDYYRSLLSIYRERAPQRGRRLVAQLERDLSEIESLIAKSEDD